ncbi:hypothetical protein NEIMUCOT_06216 [Neisseria mucosa ATCC 25996]|uniref:Uncharacterized protein n=1 Tax=Neisseria mucosa (strain ATCC 25996 / DSM 4631 / NCTC 10774 / M26) TaxID=546266 RepID=D2ZZY2_NEIM2|nr:hypothetical protein [Neisseria mucosa]EFC87333.1 hypothetical protein NEIMUCOT_06216 [Neisseria mucosa ATCC 25996]
MLSFPLFEFRDDLLLRSLGLRLSASAGRIGLGVILRSSENYVSMRQI